MQFPQPDKHYDSLLSLKLPRLIISLGVDPMDDHSYQFQHRLTSQDYKLNLQ